MKLVGESIPDYVKKQIQVRQSAYGSGSLLESPRTDEILLHQNSNNAFIKMASGVSVTEEKLKEIQFSATEASNLKEMGLAKNYVLFGGTSQMGTTETGNGVLNQKTDFLESQRGNDLTQNGGAPSTRGAYDASQDWGIVPMPGIESLEVKSLNRGSLKKATVKLTAQNRNQLAILDILYMRLGYTVLIEWGNAIYMASSKNDKKGIEPGRLQQMYTSIIEDNNLFFNSSWSSHRSYNDITTEIAKNRELYDGNFDALLGKVSNFNWSFNPDGSYSIELTIISLGDVVESLKTNVAANYEVIGYVDDEAINWGSETDSLDQHRKDNVILSLLHVFRVQNQFTQGRDITVESKQYENGSLVQKPLSYLGNLLLPGSSSITTYTNTVTSTVTLGFKKPAVPPAVERWIQPSDLTEGYYDGEGKVLTKTEAETRVRNIRNSPTHPNNPVTGAPYKLEDFKGWGYDVHDDPIRGGKRASIVFAFNYASIVVSDTLTIPSGVDWGNYKNAIAAVGDDITALNTKDPTNPAIKFRWDFYQKYKDVKFTDKFLNTEGSERQAYSLIQGLFRTDNGGFASNGSALLNSIQNYTPARQNNNGLALYKKEFLATNSSIVKGKFSNPLRSIGYEANDAFVLKLDKPEYYMRFGFLLDLLKQKVVTRIDTKQSNYTSNPNLFDINSNPGDNLMLCLPLQISYDWRTCIVKRADFDRKGSFNQNVFPELEQWALSETIPHANTAFITNIYLNFNFISEVMSSNMDERRNVSVYDFIKGLCDGINRAMAGVNNLEPIIDEDTNTLRIFDSSPIPKSESTPDYTLQLYGYGNGVTSPTGNSTFVRKVDLKTAITPEYATMVTVGATANGYVKGTEATAFARWNKGLTDRFKTELLAADPDTKSDKNSREDTINSFYDAMKWSSRSFGIEGIGYLWETFKLPTAASTPTPAKTFTQRIVDDILETLKNLTPDDN
jgi:hypothetical protein